MTMPIVQVALGALVAIAVALSIVYLRSPKLRVTVAEPSDRQYGPNSPARKARYLILELSNKTPPSWLSWVPRSPAMQCVGNMTFHHLDDGQNIFGRSMPVRWSQLPEPVAVSHAVAGHNPLAVTTTPRVDIYPGETQPFNVVARFDDEKECYGWSNENYFSQPVWRHPKWKLPHGRYLARVTIVSSGQKCVAVVRVINDVGQDDFRLESTTADDVKKVRD